MNVAPEAELVQLFRDQGGAGKPTHAGLKVCWSQDEAQARARAEEEARRKEEDDRDGDEQEQGEH